MKILMLADTEESALWDDWSEETASKLADIGLILSAGDLDADYLEFLVTMLNVPLVYVRGNHDGDYDRKPPEGCIDADGRVVEVNCDDAGGARRLKILGLGGSMRYRDNAADMYTEDEMRRRIAGVRGNAFRDLISGRISGSRDIDLLLTHAPCRGYGDMEDLPHNGFECFNDLIERHSPAVHCYGHVHREYGDFRREILHPSGTRLVNASGSYICEL